MSTSSWAAAQASRFRNKGWAPRRDVLASEIPNDATRSVDRLAPEVFGPLYMRQRSEMTASANDAEIVSKEYVDSFSAGVGRLNESLRQPYQLSRWYSSSHGWRRQTQGFVDGDVVVSALYTERNITIDALRLEITTAGAANSTATLGLYTLAFNTLLPSALLLNAGTVAVDAIAKVTLTLGTAQAVTGPTWLGLAVSINGGNPTLSVDKCNVGTAMQVPYGWSALPFTTAANAKYALYASGAGGSLPAASSFTTATTVSYGSGLWVRRSA